MQSELVRPPLHMRSDACTGRGMQSVVTHYAMLLGFRLWSSYVSAHPGSS